MENLARGLRVEDFNFAKRSTPLEFGGIDVTIPFLTASPDSTLYRSL